MPKLIDYPRTTYAGAWEVAEVVDDTGGKCAIDTAARKLNRKVSGSFKAIIGSAVKFGLLTSKRELLSTTTLFRRIKHAYDKKEELLFHREAFLTPPLFTQLCRKFRSRELPVQMLDVMLIREFGVEEINAQGVAKAFTEGARMVGLLDENNVVADIDQLAAQQPPRREIAAPPPNLTSFRPTIAHIPSPEETDSPQEPGTNATTQAPSPILPKTVNSLAPPAADAIATLFGLGEALHHTSASTASPSAPSQPQLQAEPTYQAPATSQVPVPARSQLTPQAAPISYLVQITGPGLETQVTITEEEDLMLVQALLNKIKRQLIG